MNKLTLLRAVVLIIPQGILKAREFKKRFWAEMAARIHQLLRGMWGRFCDTFVFRNSSNGSILPVVQVPVRAKVRAKLAPTAFIRCSLVFRSSS
ncbi:MAG: hypothetical protein H8D56_25355 [Planctomycetes bacterium]|nr:hypothetical protein [Planctomycetota bacterium]MBL7147177.1 hypothetical protein [Phycisphaerae bacterium]